MDESPDKPAGTKAQTAPSRGGGHFWFFCALFVLSVVYPLGIGPAAIIHHKHPAARPAITAIYKPLMAVIEQSPRLQSFYSWYLFRLWRFDPSAPPPPTATTNSVPVSGK